MKQKMWELSLKIVIVKSLYVIFLHHPLVDLSSKETQFFYYTKPREDAVFGQKRWQRGKNLKQYLDLWKNWEIARVYPGGT